MIPLFTKPLNQLTLADVQQLVTEAVPEGQTVEFKSALADKRGGASPWLSGGEIGDGARNDVLKGVVAFANSGGGNLILGIAETDDHPKRAANVAPLPRCHELADRFRLMARECIEPQLPSLEVRGITTDHDDPNSGVVLFRVPPSRLAPHRLEPTHQCYLRRADRSEKMTMREIQDASVRLGRDGEDIERRLEESRDHYDQLITPRGSQLSHDVVGIRIAALPAGGKIYIERTYEQSDLQPLRPRIGMQYDGRNMEVYFPGWNELPSCPYRPVLRGARRTLVRKTDAISQAVYSDGLVEFFFKRVGEKNPIFIGWVCGMVANALFVADAARHIAGVPGAEIILDVELRSDSFVGPLLSSHNHLTLAFGEDKDLWSTSGPTPIRLPLQSVTGLSDVKPAMKRMLDDLENACGRRHADQFDIDL